MVSVSIERIDPSSGAPVACDLLGDRIATPLPEAGRPIRSGLDPPMITR